jgi:hypothetical protein
MGVFAHRGSALAGHHAADVNAKQQEDFARFQASVNGHQPGLPAYKLASEIPPERVSWIWYGFLAEGKISIMDGNPKLGKSLLTTDLAARISRGEAFPLSPPITRRGVILLSGEDGIADTIVPRLIVSGADLSQVAIVTGVPLATGGEEFLSLNQHLSQVESLVEKVGAALVIIDPISAYLGPGVNAYRDQDVRSILIPLKDMVERHHCSVLIVRHLNRSAGTDIVSRGSMSIGFTGTARLGMLIAKDPEDEDWRVLAQSITNISAEQPSLRFRIEPVPDTDVARVVWDTMASRYSAMDLLEGATTEEEKGARSEAEAWLEDFLSFGPQPAKDVQRAAKNDGHSERTLDRAKAKLGVRSVKDAFSGGGWKWHLPRHVPEKDGAIKGVTPPYSFKPGTLRTTTTLCIPSSYKDANTKKDTSDEEPRSTPTITKNRDQAPLPLTDEELPWNDQ